MVTAGSAANATVHAGGEATERAGEKEGGKSPLFFGDGVEVSGGGGDEVGGTEGVDNTAETVPPDSSSTRPCRREWGRDG